MAMAPRCPCPPPAPAEARWVGGSRRRLRLLQLASRLPGLQVAARVRTVVWVKRSTSGISRPSRSWSSACTRVRRSEWPPRSKKLSWMPTARQPRTSLQTRGDGLLDRVPAARRAGRGRPRRLSAARQGLAIHLAVGRERQRREDDERGGHHGLGQPLAQEARGARRPAAGVLGDPAATSRRPAAGRPRARPTTAARDAGCSRSAASISPGSMR